ncbi:MAG: hypothetical protein IJP80_03600 [Bacteroidales bacterium]|nr:hypothetical protein [Bacteroidales bacterium]
MRKKLLLFFTLLPVLDLSAQISELEEVLVSSSGNYIHYTSVVRNYNDTINILMQYGRFQTDMATDSAVGHCTFYTQNTNTGVITRLFDLTRGYKVNDVRFVTLRKMDGVSTEDFCCFCGTRSQFEMYEYPISLDPGALPIEIHSKHGFAGFFSMSDALNPTASCTVKFRDVEDTKELYRMTCYAESEGMYYTMYDNVPFLDNAVMDIIGLDDTVNAPSCFCRVKFYPDIPGVGVYWDNNMRYNQTEVVTDITRTDDYVVTVSNHANGDGLWVRNSGKEDHLVIGGMELNDYVGSIIFNSAPIVLSCSDSKEINSLIRLDDAKICHTENNEVETVFRIAAMGYGGLMACRYDYSSGTMTFSKGAYLHCIPGLKEVLHMPTNNTSVFLFSQNTDYVTALSWNIDKKTCNYPVKQFYRNNINAQSISLQRRNGYEHLFWSGRQTNNTISNMFLMSQRGQNGGGYNKTCHERNDNWSQPVMMEHTDKLKYLRIRIRYGYDNERYPVTYINFTPQNVEKNFNCVKD